MKSFWSIEFRVWKASGEVRDRILDVDENRALFLMGPRKVRKIREKFSVSQVESRTNSVLALQGISEGRGSRGPLRWSGIDLHDAISLEIPMTATCGALVNVPIKGHENPPHLASFACGRSNRIRKFLSADCYHHGRWIPQALIILTLVLNGVNERSDEFRLKDYGCIEVFPHRQRQNVLAGTSTCAMSCHCGRMLSNIRSCKHPLTIWWNEGWWGIETMHVAIAMEHRSIKRWPVNLVASKLETWING